MKESITLDEFLEYLNRLAKADPRTMGELLETRVGPCNEKLLKDTDCQLQLSWTPELKAHYRVGPLGVLSGIFGVNPEAAGDRAGWSRICAVYDVCCPHTQYHLDTMCGGFPLKPSCDVTQEELDKLSVGKPCPKCGTELVLGRLQGFQRTWKGESTLKTVG